MPCCDVALRLNPAIREHAPYNIMMLDKVMRWPVLKDATVDVALRRMGTNVALEVLSRSGAVRVVDTA